MRTKKSTLAMAGVFLWSWKANYEGRNRTAKADTWLRQSRELGRRRAPAIVESCGRPCRCTIEAARNAVNSTPSLAW